MRDAHFDKVRDGYRVVSRTFLCAAGVNDQGRWEVRPVGLGERDGERMEGVVPAPMACGQEAST